MTLYIRLCRRICTMPKCGCTTPQLIEYCTDEYNHSLFIGISKMFWTVFVDCWHFISGSPNTFNPLPVLSPARFYGISSKNRRTHPRDPCFLFFNGCQRSWKQTRWQPYLPVSTSSPCIRFFSLSSCFRTLDISGNLDPFLLFFSFLSYWLYLFPGQPAVV